LAAKAGFSAASAYRIEQDPPGVPATRPNLGGTIKRSSAARRGQVIDPHQ
jgi:hypothetical protein